MLGTPWPRLCMADCSAGSSTGSAPFSSRVEWITASEYYNRDGRLPALIVILFFFFLLSWKKKPEPWKKIGVMIDFFGCFNNNFKNF